MHGLAFACGDTSAIVNMRGVIAQSAVRRATTLAGSVVIGLSTVALSQGTAVAAGLTSHHVAGIQSDISCLSKQLCVAVGYNNASKADVVALNNGVPAHVSVVPGSDALYSVSCVAAKGCVAVGQSNKAGGPTIVTIGKNGRTASVDRPKAPAGVSLSRIACITLTNCEVVGNDVFTTPASIAVASWNGHKLTVHTVHGLKGSSMSIQGVGCRGSSCLVVGYALDVATTTGVVVPVHHGKPGAITKVPGRSLTGVACTTAARCFVVGYSQTGGFIATLNNTKVLSSTPEQADLFAIACHLNACTSVGEELPPPSYPQTDAFVGVVVSMTSGAVTSTQVAGASDGLEGVAQPTTGLFAAIGAAQTKGSVVTTG